MNNDSKYDDATDDETGLSAFDDLDPVSAVSELTPTPGYPAPDAYQQPQGADTAVPSVMPPPITSTRPYTDAPPPPVPGYQHHAQAGVPLEHDASAGIPAPGPDPDATMQFSTSELEGATELENQPQDQHPDYAAAPITGPGVAADLQMDWDDDEMETRLHHGVDLAAWREQVASDAAAAPNSVVPGGAPSPFPAAPQDSMGPPSQMRPPAPGVDGHGTPLADVPPSPRAPTMSVGQGAVSSTVHYDPLADAPNAESRWGARMALMFTVVFLCGGALWAAQNILSTPEATITLATTPADAEVTFDGEPLTGQTSPYVLNVVAEEEHALVVRKEGYEPFKMSLKAQKGENKALPQIELKQTNVQVGFSIGSDPAGAKIFVDGQDSGQVTPARVLDVAKGTHSVKLVSAEGYRPFEIQVFVPEGQVVELPEAELERGTDGSKRAGAASRRDSRASERSSGSLGGRQKAAKATSSSRRPSRAQQSSGRQRQRASGGGGSSPFGTPKRTNRAAGSGASGTLRLNSRPWAQIAIDGRPVGNTPQLNLKVPAGAHTIKFSNPQLGLAKTIKLRVGKGKVVTRVVNLIE